MNIANQLQKIGICVYQDGFIPALKQMTDPLFTLVDIPGKTKADVLHDFGKGDFRHLDGKMDMICHAAKGMNPVAVFFNTFLKEQIETCAILP